MEFDVHALHSKDNLLVSPFEDLRASLKARQQDAALKAARE